MITRNNKTIFGLPFNAINLNTAVSTVYRSIEEGKRLFLTTPNLNFAITALHDDAFYQSVVDSDLVVVDGMPLVWIAKLLGIPVSERVAGSDLFERLSSIPRENKIRVFFFGGEAGVAECAAEKLNATSQGMVCCGFYDPGFVCVEDMSSPDIIDLINQASPDFLVVALGAKKGQAWIQHNRHQLNATVISHLGAVINFVAGSVKRAPEMWQKLGLEWCWRIVQEPGLWKRYFFDGLAVCRLLLTKVLPLAVYDRWLKRQFNTTPASYSLRYECAGSTLYMQGMLGGDVMPDIRSQLALLVEQVSSDIVVDFSLVDYVDSAFLASLLLFQHQLNHKHFSIKLVKMPKPIRKLFHLHLLTARFTFN